MTKKDKRKKLYLNEKIANEYFSEIKLNDEKLSSTKILTELTKEIACGKYDEKIKKMPSKKSVQKNVSDEYVEKARKKATELGYNKLSDLVEEVMRLKTKELKEKVE
ncbi:hypothetical protein [Staphylococcus haemolyticus]|uniref:hypothetical protein n=1 Tax=Staphylococcus haemolyticus TaxID=1283 RepID=UPI003D970D00